MYDINSAVVAGLLLEYRLKVRPVLVLIRQSLQCIMCYWVCVWCRSSPLCEPPAEPLSLPCCQEWGLIPQTRIKALREENRPSTPHQNITEHASHANRPGPVFFFFFFFWLQPALTLTFSKQIRKRKWAVLVYEWVFYLVCFLCGVAVTVVSWRTFF